MQNSLHMQATLIQLIGVGKWIYIMLEVPIPLPPIISVQPLAIVLGLQPLAQPFQITIGYSMKMEILVEK
jgi:hypothetical protein